MMGVCIGLSHPHLILSLCGLSLQDSGTASEDAASGQLLELSGYDLPVVPRRHRLLDAFENEENVGSPHQRPGIGITNWNLLEASAQAGSLRA